VLGLYLISFVIDPRRLHVGDFAGPHSEPPRRGQNQLALGPEVTAHLFGRDVEQCLQFRLTDGVLLAVALVAAQGVHLRSGAPGHSSRPPSAIGIPHHS